MDRKLTDKKTSGYNRRERFDVCFILDMWVRLVFWKRNSCTVPLAKYINDIS